MTIFTGYIAADIVLSVGVLLLAFAIGFLCGMERRPLSEPFDDTDDLGRL